MTNLNILVVSRSASVARFIGCKLRQQGHRGGLEYLTEAPQVEERIAIAMPDILFVESCYYHCVTANMLAKLVRKFKKLPVCVYAVEDCPPRTAARFIYWGVQSYVNFRDDPEEYLPGLTLILSGRPYMPEYVARIAEDFDETPSRSLDLTPREEQIVHLIAAGKSSDEIATTLDLKPKTVENHKLSLYGKCNVKNSIELLRFAINQGVLSTEELCS